MDLEGDEETGGENNENMGNTRDASMSDRGLASSGPDTIDEVRPLVIEALQALNMDNPDEGILKDDLFARLGKNASGNAAMVETILEELNDDAKIFMQEDGTIQFLSF